LLPFQLSWSQSTAHCFPVWCSQNYVDWRPPKSTSAVFSRLDRHTARRMRRCTHLVVARLTRVPHRWRTLGNRRDPAPCLRQLADRAVSDRRVTAPLAKVPCQVYGYTRGSNSHLPLAQAQDRGAECIGSRPLAFVGRHPLPATGRCARPPVLPLCRGTTTALLFRACASIRCRRCRTPHTNRRGTALAELHQPLHEAAAPSTADCETDCPAQGVLRRYPRQDSNLRPAA
jgi:hypothetical protein